MSPASEYRRRLNMKTDIQQHMWYLHSTVLSYAAPVVIELGVGWGNSTSALLAAVTEADGMLWSVDRGEVRKTGMIPDDWWGDAHWKFLQADDLSEEAGEWLPGRCDVLFVDSDHSYEHVLATLETHMPRVRPGGIALFHDTQFRHPATDLGEPTGDVARALDDYCARQELAWVNRAGSYGLGVVRL